MQTSTLAKQFFEDGFVVVPNLLDSGQVQALNQRVDAILAGAAPHPQKFIHLEPEQAESPLVHIDKALVVRKICNLAILDPVIGELLETPSVISTATEILGPDIKLLNDQMLCKPARFGSAKPYHQDSAYWPIEPMELMNMWIALDDATPENGCLRYLKGSHKNGLLPHEEQLGHHRMPAGWSEMSGRLEEVVVPVPAGGCICHHSLVLHESTANESWDRRRGLSLVFMRSTSKWTSENPQPKFRLIAGQAHEGCV